jgi:putative transposase
MQLVEQHIIKKDDERYKILDEVCFKSKNLYNAALYEIRQHFFNTKQFLNWFSVDKLFKEKKQEDYYALPCKVSQQTLKLLNQNFKSFFSLLKKKDHNKKKSIPKYLDKVKGRFVAIYTNQAFSKKEIKRGIIHLSGTDFKIKTKIDRSSINQVRIVPKNSYYKVEVIYEIDEIEELEDNDRYAAIDLGVNNLATVSFNDSKPFIINGKPLKSINQFYNKRKAELQSKLKGNRKTSNRIESITRKRNNRVKNYLHKASRYIVNHLVSTNINTLIIGKNDNWKQEANISKKNNQNFVLIPHSQFINMLSYKCKLVGIAVIMTEESYTSKCSFIDNEEMKHNENYKGKRVKRGLFRTNKGKFINADLNGSLNIMRKVIGEFQYPIEVCSTPLVKTMFDTIKLNFFI